MTTRVLRAIRLLLSLVLALPALAHAAATASVDRNAVALGDSLTLTVSADGNTFSSPPDFSALSKDFDIARGISRGSQLSIVNGRVSATTTWQVALLPRRTGTLVIPALTIGSEQTAPLQVQVRTAPAAGAAAGGAPASNDPVTLVATIDATRGLQRSQRILTLRGWFEGISASDVSIEPPTAPDFQIVSLGEPTTYAQERNGHRYQVIEARFAVFPQHSGRVVIPAAKLNAVIQGESIVRNFFRVPTQQRIRRLSAPIVLDVQPVPVAGLPVADAVTIDTDWSTPPDSLRAGVPVTLTLTVTAKGALPDAMSAADIVVPDSVRRYTNPAKRASSHGPDGLVTTVTSTLALIPQFGGRIDMPPVELRWWNAKQSREETTSVALPPLIVAGAAATLAAPTTAAAGGASAAGNPAPRALAATEPSPALAWAASPLVVMLFGALLLASLLANVLLGWLLWRRRQTLPSARTTLRDLQQAITAGDAGRTRDALLAWVRQRQGQDSVQTLDEVARLLPARARGIAALEVALYGSTANAAANSAASWQALLADISARDFAAGNRRAQRQALPPLYPPAS